jgi:anaerobic magnesium-protoporphyrin IX monomethyl ester cyclase
LWLIYAACVAEKNQFDVSFIDAPAKQMNAEQTLKKVKQDAADAKLFVFDTSTPSIYSDIEFAGQVKKLYPDAFIMLVGTHPSATPDETMGISNLIDGLARHEYDYIVRDTAIALRDNADLKSVRGLTYRDGETIIHNPDAEHITDLDEIPYAAEFIKRRLCVTDYVFPAAAFPSIQIFTGRGCPAQCNFCVYPQTLHGHRYRLRSPENVIGEIEYIVKKFPSCKRNSF